MDKALIILLIFISKQYSFTQSINYKEGDTLNVFAISGLKLRNEKGTNSKALVTMRFGERVVVIDSMKLDKKNTQSIEGIYGNWIKVKYDSLEGYAFDGFLSSLPIPKIDTKKIKDVITFEINQNAYTEGEWAESRRIEFGLGQYFNKSFYTIGKVTIKNNKVDGEGFLREDLQKISHGFTKIDMSGWEWYGFKVEMPNIRLSEIKNLILVIVKNIVLKTETVDKIKTNIKKIKENTKEDQDIFNIDEVRFKLQKSKNNNGVIIWSLHFFRSES